jgi:HK97 family phage prohead protease
MTEGYDFSGWATKIDVKCSDGRTIRANAFQHDDGKKVPLIWQHGHSDISNVLGHAILEHRAEGVYTYGFLNNTSRAQEAREQIHHGDITSLSVYATDLVERDKNVMHGAIREVSLVIAGANDGAKIETVMRHSDFDDEDVETDEAIIHSGLPIDNIAGEDDALEHAETLDFEEVYNSMDENQQLLVQYLVQRVDKAESGDDEESDDTAEHAENPDDAMDGAVDNNTDTTVQHSQEGTNDMTHNVFEGSATKTAQERIHLAHSDVKGIFEDALRLGNLKDAVEKYALQHNITNIELLFPDAQAVTNTPDLVKRRTDWVDVVLSGARHTPFSRIKSLTADLTPDEARAKGYIKGNMKKEEFFALSKRVTTPQTVYKKQRLERDDVVDIQDFDVVVWLKAEMRIMLDEEIARAALIGDGRSNADDDKIKTDNIRPIATDAELYVTTVYSPVTPGHSASLIDDVVRYRRFYKGSGNPIFFVADELLSDMLLEKDTLNRRLYQTEADLAAALRVSRIVPVEVFDQDPDLLGIMVNMADYTFGTNKGGEVTMFDDFNIDYNRYIYLLETRLCGALVRPKSALVFRRAAANATLVVPLEPEFNATTSTVTVPTVTGVQYQAPQGTNLTNGATFVITEGEKAVVYAVPKTGYYFSTNAEDEWVFTGTHH